MNDTLVDLHRRRQVSELQLHSVNFVLVPSMVTRVGCVVTVGVPGHMSIHPGFNLSSRYRHWVVLHTLDNKV
jgi:hypothetical protein